MSKNIIILRLEGALQSWGEKAVGDIRPTADFPTKSAIVGLVGCAMGFEREDPALKELYNAVEIGVRADRAGVRLTDYHTVTGNPMRTADGKKRSGVGNTIITNRMYLQDAAFTVFLSAEGEWHDRIVQALQHPVWPMFLGRKSCVPSRPVFMQVTTAYSDIGTAIKEYPLTLRHDKTVTYEIETEDKALQTYTRQDGMTDVPRDFDLRRIWKGVI